MRNGNKEYFNVLGIPELNSCDHEVEVHSLEFQHSNTMGFTGDGELRLIRYHNYKGWNLNMIESIHANLINVVCRAVYKKLMKKHSDYRMQVMYSVNLYKMFLTSLSMGDPKFREEFKSHVYVDDDLDKVLMQHVDIITTRRNILSHTMPYEDSYMYLTKEGRDYHAFRARIDDVKIKVFKVSKDNYSKDHSFDVFESQVDLKYSEHDNFPKGKQTYEITSYEEIENFVESSNKDNFKDDVEDHLKKLREEGTKKGYDGVLPQHQFMSGQFIDLTDYTEDGDGQKQRIHADEVICAALDAIVLPKVCKKLQIPYNSYLWNRDLLEDTEMPNWSRAPNYEDDTDYIYSTVFKECDRYVLHLYENKKPVLEEIRKTKMKSLMNDRSRISNKHCSLQRDLNNLCNQWDSSSLSPLLDISNTDTVVHNLFHFIEKGLKTIIQDCNGDQYEKGRKGHILSLQFGKLKEHQQEKFQSDFEEYLELKPYMSLNSGMTSGKVCDYLAHLDDGGKGYKKWKYVSLEKGELNNSYIDAMFVVAQSAVSVILQSASNPNNVPVDKEKDVFGYIEDTAGPKERFEIAMSKLLDDKMAEFKRNSSAETLDEFDKFIEDNKLYSSIDKAKYTAKNCYCWRKDADGVKYHYSANKLIESLFDGFKEDLLSYDGYNRFPWISWIGPWLDGPDKEKERLISSGYINNHFTKIEPIFNNPTKNLNDAILPKIRRITHNYDFETLIVDVNVSVFETDTFRYNNFPFADYKKLRGDIPYKGFVFGCGVFEAEDEGCRHLENYFTSNIENNPKYDAEQIYIDGKQEENEAEILHKLNK